MKQLVQLKGFLIFYVTSKKAPRTSARFSPITFQILLPQNDENFQDSRTDGYVYVFSATDMIFAKLFN